MNRSFLLLTTLALALSSAGCGDDDSSDTVLDGSTPDDGGTPDAGPPEPCDEPGATERVACGNCGETERFCSAGGTWEYGVCQSEGECAPGTMSDVACGMCGTQTARCSDECTWLPEGTCSAEGECMPGETMRTAEGCGDGEQRTLECDDACTYVEASACESEACDSPGTIETIACGNCGTLDRFCSADGTWSYGACEGEGVCAPGSSETVDCGNCGSATRRCGTSCTWDAPGACGGEGECAPGATSITADGCPGGELRTLECDASCTFMEIEACSADACPTPGALEMLPCGNCGTMERFCGADGVWSYGSCMGEGVCAPGTTTTEACGLCGSQAKRCTASCTWSPDGLCTGEIACPLPPSTCVGSNTLRTYGTASCSAGTCSYTSTDTVCPAGCTAGACVGGATLIGGLGGPVGYGTETLPVSDDDSSAAIALATAFPSGMNFYGSTYTQLYLNNNGYVSFVLPPTVYGGNTLPSTDPVIAPWFGDVDTRGAGRPAKNNIHWFIDSNRFIATWHLVGYYNTHDDLQNSFQVILTDRSDIAPGDFDVEFRYAQCEWTTGDASGGVNGLGGDPARAGFDAGNSATSLELPGSGTATVLDLCTTSNVSVPGVWRYRFRGGNPL